MEPHEIPERVIKRIRQRSYDLLPVGCIVSTYSVSSSGYAQIGWNDDSTGHRTVANCHRLIWLAERGAIPDGMVVDHLCKRKTCINVAHLRLLTNFENARRTFGRDWPLGQCAYGHSNEHLGPVNGGRHIGCLLCQAARSPRKAAAS